VSRSTASSSTGPPGSWSRGGLHHICFETDDLDAAVGRATDAGLEIVQQGVMAGGLMSFAYVDGARWGAPYVEIVQLTDDMRAFFAAVRRDSSA